jgi:HEAT repeat protein
MERRGEIMKQLIITAFAAISIFTSAFAAPSDNSNTSTIDWQKAEKNYIVALSSSNTGLRLSAANYLAAYRLTGSVKSLIEVLQTDKVEQLRMAAAVALVQLGNKEGIDAVKDASFYDGSEKVARFCEQLIQSASQELSLK